MELIEYTVYYTSSVDKDRLDAVKNQQTKSDGLLINGRKTGWISQENPAYPEELVIQFDDTYKMKKLQVTSHPLCTARKVDVYAGHRPKRNSAINPDEASWTRIAQILFKDYGLNPTMMSEQKTLFLQGDVGFCLKFVIHENHPNKERNPFNQVGITSVRVWGRPKYEEDKEDQGKEKRSSKSRAGGRSSRRKDSGDRRRRRHSDGSAGSDDDDGSGGRRSKSRAKGDRRSKSRSGRRFSGSDSDVDHAIRIVRKHRGYSASEADSNKSRSPSKSPKNRRTRPPSAKSAADSHGSNESLVKRRSKSRQKKSPADDEEKRPPSSKGRKSRAKDHSPEDGNETDDSVKKLTDQHLSKVQQERRAARKSELPFEFDLSEFRELIEILEDRKHEALKKERYLDARNIKEMLETLKRTERTLNQLAYKRKLAIEQEDYGAAHDLKRKFTDTRQNTTANLKHLPAFLTELERKRFIEDFGRNDKRKLSREHDFYEYGQDFDDQDRSNRSGKQAESRKSSKSRADTRMTKRSGERRTPSPHRDVPDDPVVLDMTAGRNSKNPYARRPENEQNKYIEPPTESEIEDEYQAQQRYRNARLDQLRTEREKTIDRYPDEKTVTKIVQLDRTANPELRHVLNWIVGDMKKHDRKHLDPRVQKLMVKHDIFSKSANSKPPPAKPSDYTTKDAEEVGKMLESL